MTERAIEEEPAVRAIDVLHYFGIDVERRDGRIVFVRQCPRCGPRASAAVAVELESGRWFDESRACRGELVELVAGYADVPIEAVDAILGMFARRRAIATYEGTR